MANTKHETHVRYTHITTTQDTHITNTQDTHITETLARAQALDFFHLYFADICASGSASVRILICALRFCFRFPADCVCAGRGEI